MATLHVYVPFPRVAKNPPDKGKRSDLREDSAQLAQCFVPQKISGIQVDACSVFFADERGGKAVEPGDIFVVFAHGGDFYGPRHKKHPGEDYLKLTDNQGSKIKIPDLIDHLQDMTAGNAAYVVFAACFSALPGHIAPSWAAVNGNQPVYGCTTELQGALVKFTSPRRDARQQSILKVKSTVGKKTQHSLDSAAKWAAERRKKAAAKGIDVDRPETGAIIAAMFLVDDPRLTRIE
jgi:hypothetical protein